LGGGPHLSVPLPAESALQPYVRAADLIGDLSVLRASLIRNRGRRLARMLIDPLLLEVRTYGLHLQTLDIRQHARVHAAAIAELKRVYVPESLPRYVISGATSAEDVLNVLWLARLGGVHVEGSACASND